MAADGKLLLRFLLLHSLVMGALCCTCTDTPPETQFCVHEYVMKVVVKGVKHMPKKTRYRAEMIQSFKGDMKGETYVIFGSNIGGKIYTGRFSGNVNWNNASETLTNNLNSNTYIRSPVIVNRDKLSLFPRRKLTPRSYAPQKPTPWFATILSGYCFGSHWNEKYAQNNRIKTSGNLSTK